VSAIAPPPVDPAHAATPHAPAPAAAQPLLRVRNLCKYYPVFSKKFLVRQTGVVKACHNVSFDLMPGETLGLVGESGCGKTTTGRAILRAITPTSGQVLFRDGDREVDLATLAPAALKPLRTKLQMIFQDPFASLNPRMTVRTSWRSRW
jgi:peptide/nickel transport system ATP-binding protein